MLRTVSLLIFGAAFGWIGGQAVGSDPQQSFAAVRKLEEEGRHEEAFLACLPIPGAQHIALEMARGRPAEYLNLLRRKGDGIATPLTKAVEGDLLLALGKTEEALGCYRTAAGTSAAKAGEGWLQGRIPADEYVVEPPPPPPRVFRPKSPVVPFAEGPGSHRDNWLLRRFIALAAWEDASREFARVWEAHRGHLRPYRIPSFAVPGWEPARQYVVHPAGFGPRALHFALDYAFFLQDRRQQQRALAVLQEPLLAMDMDRNPDTAHVQPAGAGEDVSGYPLWACGPTLEARVGSLMMSGYIGERYAGICRKEFIRLASGAFQTCGKEAELIAAIQKRIDAGENRLRRVLARIRMHQGKIEESLAQELRYVEQAKFDPFSAALRRAMVFEDVRHLAEAAEAYELAIKLPLVAKTQLPEGDVEEEAADWQWRNLSTFDPAWRPANGEGLKWVIFVRLQRLYTALGQPERALQATLRKFELCPNFFTSRDALRLAGQQASVLQRKEQFGRWLRAQAAVVRSDERAGIEAILSDYPAGPEAALAAPAQQCPRPAGAAAGFGPWAAAVPRCPVVVQPSVGPPPPPGLTLNEGIPAALASPDPMRRAAALSRLMDGHFKTDPQHLGTVAAFVHDKEFRPRATAVFLLSHMDAAAAVPPLEEATKDPDPRIRAAAALGLIRQGRVPPIPRIREIMETKYDAYPVGECGASVLDIKTVIDALAPYADAEIFRLCLEHPVDCSFGFWDATFVTLGQSLLRHPDAAQVLLAAYDPSYYRSPRREFSRAVFRAAGPQMLPALHKALQSTDRVVRSNAARACGAIGDRSSIEPLIKALGLESGLAHASIVTALGELRARESLPLLTAFYIDARNDKQTGGGTGFLWAEREAQCRAEYEAISESGAIAKDVKAAAAPGPVNRWEPEPPPALWAIFEAIHAIGPELSQKFYRNLAGERDTRARFQAAQRMAECDAGDARLNAPVLRMLSVDQEELVSMEAAVSLLLLGDHEVEGQILAWIESPQAGQRFRITEALYRVREGKTLAFTRQSLERLRDDTSPNGNCRDFARGLLKRISGER
jgi:HEAT repeat protein/predicted negative regulator of RcsB-dependent stress response